MGLLYAILGMLALFCGVPIVKYLWSLRGSERHKRKVRRKKLMSRTKRMRLYAAQKSRLMHAQQLEVGSGSAAEAKSEVIDITQQERRMRGLKAYAKLPKGLRRRGVIEGMTDGILVDLMGINDQRLYDLLKQLRAELDTDEDAKADESLTDTAIELAQTPVPDDVAHPADVPKG